MAEFIATVKAVLDDSELKKLDNISDKKAEVKVKLSGDVNQLDNVNRNISEIIANARTPIRLTINSDDVHTELNLIEDQLRRIESIHLNLGGNGRTRNANREVSRQFAEAMSLRQRMFKNLKNIQKLDVDRDIFQIDTLRNQVRDLRLSYNDIINDFGNGFSDAQNDRLRRAEEQLTEQIAQIQAKLQDTISKNLQEGKYNNLLSSLFGDFNKLQNPSNEIVVQIDNVTDALQRMRNANSFDDLWSAFNDFQHNLASTKSNIELLLSDEKLFDKQRKAQDKALKEQRKAQDDALKAQQKATKLSNDKNILSEDIDLWSRKNTDSIKDASSILNGTFGTLEERIQNLKQSIQSCNDEVDLSNLKQQFQQIQKEVANFDFVNDIKKSAGFGEFDLQFDNLKDSLNQIKKVSPGLKSAFDNIKTAKENFDNSIKSNDTQSIINDYYKLQDAIESYNAEYKKVKQEQDRENASKNLKRQKESLKNDIDNWLKENSAAANEFGAELLDIKSKIDSCNQAQLDSLKDEFNDVKIAAEKAGKATLSFGDKLKRGITDEFTQLFSISRLFDYGVDALRDMYNQVVEVDSAMINLKKVTDETDATYNKFLDTAADTAIGLGRSMSSYIGQTADWTKLGYTLKEAEGLAKLSSVYANVAEIDDATAVSDMVTAMKAFNIEATNAVQITDALNELGNTFATDAGALGQGLTKAAASMSNAGADLNQTLAMLTGGTEITQNATEFGNFLKTASMRIRGMKGELEELGEEVDPTVDSISKVQTQILNITKNTSKPINIFDDSGEFRNYYTIMEEIASIYDELSSTDQAKLDEILFGKVRANQGAALIKAFQSGQIQEAYKTALGSEGSAAAEQEKWMEGLEAKMASFEAAWQHLSTSIMQSDFLGGLISAGTTAVEVFADLVDTIGILPTLLSGRAIVSFISNLGSFENIGNIKNLLDEFIDNGFGKGKDFGKILKSKGFTADVVAKSMSSVLSGVDGLGDDFLEGVLEGFGEDGVKAFQKLSKESKNFGEAFSNIGTKLKDTGKGIWSFLTQNWMAIAAAAVVATVAIVAYSNSFTKLRKDAEKSKEVLEQTKSEITSLEDQKKSNQEKIDKLSTEGTSASEAEIKALERQNTLLQAQIELKKEIEQYQRQEAAEDANKALTKQTQSIAWKDGYHDIIDVVSSDINRLNALENGYNNVIDKLAEYNDKKADGIELSKAEQDDYKQLIKDAENYEIQIKYLKEDITNDKQTIFDLYESLLNPDGSIIQGFETTANRITSVFPELIDGTSGLSDNLQKVSNSYSKSVGGDSGLVSDFDSWLRGLSETDQEIVYELFCNTDMANASLLDYQNALAATKAKIQEVSSMPIDIEVETAGIETINNAINENSSATGLAIETVAALRNRYKALDDFNPGELFENTSSGIRLNVNELSRLESRYKGITKQKFADSLQELVGQYNDLTKQIKNCNSETAKEDLNAKRNDIIKQIDEVERLASAYAVLTSGYSTWQNALSTENGNNQYSTIQSQYDNMKAILDAGWYGNDDLNSYLDMMLGSENRTDDIVADFKKLKQTIDGTSNSLMDYWKFNGDTLTTDGLFNFLDDVNKKLGDSFAGIDKDGKYFFDFTGDKLQQVADAFGTSTEVVEMFAKALGEAGMAVNFGELPLADQIDKSLENLKDYQTKGKLSDSLNLDFDVEEDSLDSVKENIDAIKDERLSVDGKVDPKLVAELDSLIEKCEKQYYLRLNTETDGSLDNAAEIIDKINKVMSANGVAGGFKLPIEEQQAIIGDLASQLANLPKETQIAIGISEESVSDVDKIVEQIKKNSQSITLPVNFTPSSETQEEVITATIDYILGDVAVPEGVTATGTLNWENNVTIPEGLVANGIINWSNNYSKPAVVDGTAWNFGSAYVNGTAFARGDWGTKSNGVALGGEEGQELIVRDGKFFTIGDKSAEFFRYKKNDIIFNAEQTKQILTQGRITRGHRRGTALADGTVNSSHFSGMAFYTGSNGNRRPNSGSYSSNGSGGNSGNKKNDPDLMDWIEVLIDRIDRAIDSFTKKVDNIFDSFENRNKALEGQMETIREQIENQKQAYERYIAEADSVKLSDDLKELVQSGAIDISQYDKKTQEKIADYQEWYEKALDCKEAVDDLSISLSECYQTAFDNVVTQYEQLVSVIEHGKAILDESISQSEARGYIVSTKYYETQIAEEQKIIDKIAAERAELIKKRDEAVMSGAIVEGSEAWMDMNEEINACTEEIEAANTSILELNNSIRDTEWQIFDLLQEKISNIAQETDFLIDLMSNDKLHDDKGVLTDEGFATVGLHSQNYNTYMAQADIYADEIAKLNKQIEDDPFDQDLLNRRQELLELQQDNILAAEDEKQTIVDLVQNGIDLELESLQELIDKYKEKLNVQKDLYDYNKELEEQTKEIATLEKQLAAYKDNESEEIKAKVQQIKVSLEEAKSNLEETQYDRFISDQEKLLDELYTEYEQILNERLDNVDELISDLIDNVNNNSSTINTTLSEKADSVGYTISDSIKGIWDNEDGAKNIITKYGDDFLVKSTTTNNILSAINSNIMNMVSQLNVLAETDINGISSADEYSSGVRKIRSSEAAWTQEGGEQEYIVRPSDGAILTPVAQDDDILNAQASNNIWSMANNPVDFIHDNLVGSTPAPVVKSNNQSFIQHFDKIVFSMPNVTNYSEMLNEMKHDRKFEKLVTAMTIDRLSGKSHLGVGKSF